jgi:hypothetical protein
VTQEEVLELKVDREHQMIVVSTESPAKLATRLSEVVQQTGFQVSEVRSEDESLQSLFSMLMQLHRGER